jgi:hypothetical protein
LAGRVLAGSVGHVQRTHRAVARRAFAPTWSAGAPVRGIHDGIAGLVYLTIRGGGSAAGMVAGELLSMLQPTTAPAGSAPGGNLALAALNAVAGDRLAHEGNALAIPTALRVGGSDVAPTSSGLATAFPAATPRLAGFVHGLSETEHMWQPAPNSGDISFGHRLAAEFGYTPVYVRYNTGRHISSNGRELARLLSQLVDAWPVRVDELLLVGHSMGGLVVRSACHYGQPSNWVGLVRHVFYLGSPHLGAPLARVAGRAGWALAKLPETRSFVPLVNGSSAGVKDLRFGYVLDDDWLGCDADRCMTDHRHDAPLLTTANHYVISVTVTADPHHPAGKVVGDLLVQPASAHGRHGRHQLIHFPVDGGRRLGSLHHLHLLKHRAVCARILAVASKHQIRSAPLPRSRPEGAGSGVRLGPYNPLRGG